MHTWLAFACWLISLPSASLVSACVVTGGVVLPATAEVKLTTVEPSTGGAAEPLIPAVANEDNGKGGGSG